MFPPRYCWGRVSCGLAAATTMIMMVMMIMMIMMIMTGTESPPEAAAIKDEDVNVLLMMRMLVMLMMKVMVMVIATMIASLYP